MKERSLLKIEGSVQVNRDVETVFDFFGNPSNDKLWRTEINRTTVTGTLQIGVIVYEYSHLSKKAPDNLLKLQCVQFDRNKLAIFETGKTDQFYLKSVRQVRPVSPRTTHITYQVEFDPAIVKFALGFKLPKIIVSMKANSDMKKYLRNLAAHLQS